MSIYILPIIFIVLLVFCLAKKVKVYDCFVLGAKDSLPLVLEILPYLATIFICIDSFKASGLSNIVSTALAKPLSYIGIPSEIAQLILLTPLSGNGTTALVQEIITQYGADSYIARCASVIAGGSETIFYISAIYFSQCKVKKLRYAIPVSLLATLLGVLLACALCRVM